MRLLLLAVVLVTAPVARADSTLPGGATIEFNRLFLHENDSQTLVQPEKVPDSLLRYFNYAHCVCGQPGKAVRPDFRETSFAYELLLKNQTVLVRRPLEIWVGASCDDTVMRPMNCHRIDSAGVADIASIATTNGVTPEIPVFDLLNPEPSRQDACPKRALSATQWAIADGDANGSPDYFVSKSISTDSLPPPLPTEFKATGAESGVVLSWNTPSGDIADIAYYQALCATDSGEPGRADPPAARYMSPRGLCAADEDFELVAATVDIGSAGSAADVDESTLVNGLKQFDPKYICGESTESTATSLRLEKLKNGEPYTVVLVAIDKSGNAKGAYFTKKLTPQPATDFWEDLHDKGSDAQGGFCLIAETYGDDSSLTNALRRFRDQTLAPRASGRWLTAAYYAWFGKLGSAAHNHVIVRGVAALVLAPLVAVALLWHALTLPGIAVLIALGWVWRRSARDRSRRFAQLAASAIAALAMAVPATARAQSPYWSDPLASESNGSVADDLNVTWHVGVRVGPYTPQIDSEPGLLTNTAGEGPYRAMFGGSRITPILDLNRIVWSGVGQLGVGLSVGFMGKTAKSYAATVDADAPECANLEDKNYCIDPRNPNRLRSKGDRTSFRLIPLELTAVYRFTYLDDDFGIPLVPYVRGGLGYYVWWSTAPNGDFSVAPGASSNKARGASAGLVGAVGLQVRAERIDAAAARSMTQSGIAHAGFYGELAVGWVDGFGNSSKLNLGDKTWFAGVDFEF